MIGSGIFLVDADIARSTDSPALYLGAWVVTGILTIIAALSYGELAAMISGYKFEPPARGLPVSILR